MSTTTNYGFTLQDDKNQNFSMTILDDNLELIDTAIATKEDMLPATPITPTKKFLNGNREWSTVEVSGGGFAANLFLTSVDSDVSGYKKMDYTITEAETEISAAANNAAGEVLLEEFIYDDALDLALINNGIWTFTVHKRVSNANANASFVFKPFVRATSGTETQLFNFETGKFNNTVADTERFEVFEPTFTVNPTDRLGVKVYVKNTSPVSYSVFLNLNDGSYFTAPLRVRHNQLRDWDGDENYQHIPIAEKTKLTDTTKTVISEVDDTIEALYWGITAPYVLDLTISVPDYTITAADYDINIIPVWSSDVAAAKLEMEAYSYIDTAEITADNKITFTAFDFKPITDINIKIEVIKKW